MLALTSACSKDSTSLAIEASPIVRAVLAPAPALLPPAPRPSAVVYAAVAKDSTSGSKPAAATCARTAQTVRIKLKASGIVDGYASSWVLSFTEHVTTALLAAAAMPASATE